MSSYPGTNWPITKGTVEKVRKLLWDVSALANENQEAIATLRRTQRELERLKAEAMVLLGVPLGDR